MPIKNYSTSISENQTVGEIMALLAAKGARSVQIRYDDHNRPDGVSFMLLIHEQPIPFKLPCNFEGVFRYMLGEYRDRNARVRFEQNPESKAQARRVAWRIVKDWVAAQMALIEAEQATLAQVFLPYCVMGADNGEAVTMYDRFLDQVIQQKSLPPVRQ